MMSSLLIRDLFIESFLCKPCFRLNVCDLDSVTFQSGKFGFVDTKVSTSNIESITKLEKAGFNLIDTNIKMQRSASQTWENQGISSSYRIELVKTSDKLEVEHIAKSSFNFSRFHLDPNISDSVANEIKRNWASNFFEGKRGDCMIVVKYLNRTIGFLQLLDEEDKRTIDLIAVLKNHHGNGLASAMIRFAAKEDLTRNIVVGTQVSNIPSLRCYEKLGFRVIESNYIFHYHGLISA